MSKLCISSTGTDLEASVDPRFGRCQYFLFVDPETMNFQCIVNPAFTTGGGAGIQAAQMAVNRGAKIILTGDVGPNAFQALQAGGVKIVTGAHGSRMLLKDLTKVNSDMRDPLRLNLTRE